ncbi:hypothetical protein LXL04_023692 [Taraxacum kok-saghyz]
MTKPILACVAFVLRLHTPKKRSTSAVAHHPPGSKIGLFRSASNGPRFINTVTFDSKEEPPTLICSCSGFFFRDFDALTKYFRVIAINQLGRVHYLLGRIKQYNDPTSLAMVVSWLMQKLSHGLLILSRNGEKPKTLKSLFAWTFLWRICCVQIVLKGKSPYKNIRYNDLTILWTLKHPKHIEQLILFRATWRGAVMNHLWESNFTPMKVLGGIGLWGPTLVRRYTSARFGEYSTVDVLRYEEYRILTDYIYHTLAAKGSGALCLKVHLLICGICWKSSFTKMQLFTAIIIKRSRIHFISLCSFIIRIMMGGMEGEKGIEKNGGKAL